MLFHIVSIGTPYQTLLVSILQVHVQRYIFLLVLYILRLFRNNNHCNDRHQKIKGYQNKKATILTKKLSFISLDFHSQANFCGTTIRINHTFVCVFIINNFTWISIFCSTWVIFVWIL